MKFHKLNKVIIKEAVLFYNQCWKYRKNIFYLKEVQNEYLDKWYIKTEKYAEIVGGEAKKYKDIHKINLETITIKYKKD